MKRKHLLIGAALGALTSLAVIGLMYFGQQLAGLPFVPFDIFDWMTRTLPGGLITFGIDAMVAIITFLPLGETSSAAKTAELTIAIFQLIGGGAIFGLILAYFNEKNPQSSQVYGIIGGLALLATTLVIEGQFGFPEIGVAASAIWLALLFIGWGWILGGLVRDSGPALADAPDATMSKRQFLRVVGLGSLAVALGSLGLGSFLRKDDEEVAGESLTDSDLQTSPDDPFGVSLTSGEAASPSPAELAAREEPARGTRPELTPLDEFYRIDINTVPPRVAIDNWRLEISGLVENDLSLTIDELRAMPSVTQILTMQCISNRIGGDLTGTTRWTGVRFKDVLSKAGLKSDAAWAVIRSADDFFESVSMEDIMDDRTLLVYEMNGVTLPVKHGFPLRIYIPNRYGMKQPKWIESIEIVDAEVQGYWVVRGWSENAFVRTTSVVDTVAVDMMTGQPDTKMVSAGGIAWAGARGISKVEIQVDDGPWEETRLLSPPLSPLTWVQWKYDWEYEEGRHEFRVRCYDGDGELQTTEENPPRPDGATGIHSVDVRV